MKNLIRQRVCNSPYYYLYNKKPYNIASGYNVHLEFLIMKHRLYHSHSKGFYNLYASGGLSDTISNNDLRETLIYFSCFMPPRNPGFRSTKHMPMSRNRRFFSCSSSGGSSRIEVY
ncbi:hypothetical protein D3C74_406050 [compost metagenome]